MNRAAWFVGADETGSNGLLPLYYKMDKRGDNRLIPAAAGVIAYPKRGTETVHSLRLVVTGDVNESGVATADSRAGLAANLAYIFTNVINHAAATVTATVQVSGGATSKTGAVQVIDLIEDRYNLDSEQGIFTGTLRLNIVGGILA